MHLGDFGESRPSAEETFGYFGETLRVHPDLSDLAIVDLFDSMSSAQKDGAAAMAAIRGIGAALIHPDDVDRFWALARANRQTMEDVATLAMQLIGALAERPTLLPSVSSDGQQDTSPTSEGDSSSPALRLLSGRPDLQAAVLLAQEAQQVV